MSLKYVFTFSNKFRLMIPETNIIFMTLFYSFLKNSIIIIFKLCEFNVNLLTLLFFVLQKVHRPFKIKPMVKGRGVQTLHYIND